MALARLVTLRVADGAMLVALAASPGIFCSLSENGFPRDYMGRHRLGNKGAGKVPWNRRKTIKRGFGSQDFVISPFNRPI
jgi:hypothetical protein